MSFISYGFFFFFLVLCAVYFAVPKKFQWVVLLLGSYTFYLFSGIQHIAFILFTTLTTFFGARWLGQISLADKGRIERVTSDEKKELRAQLIRKKKIIVAVLLIANFLPLMFFKHFNAWINYINMFLGLVQAGTRLSNLNLILPLGISFFTFQSMGYLVDVYQEKVQPDRHLGKFALFVSYFPQLLQGPISRYDGLAHQFDVPHRFDYTRFRYGAMLIVWGFFQQLVIADHLGLMINMMRVSPNGYTGYYVLLYGVAYSFQVYCSFAGGIDIARGVSQILGIELPENFLRPYLAETMPDFWRRWHVTLNNWWRDYVFYPLTFSAGFVRFGKFCRKLFGSKLGKLIPVYLATMLVRVINAMWHGASLKYVASGFYFGFVIIVGMQCGPYCKKLTEKLKLPANSWVGKLFRILRTYVLVMIGRILASANSFMDSLRMIRNLFRPAHAEAQLLQPNVIIMLIVAILLLLIVDVTKERGIRIREAFDRKNLALQWAMLIVLITGIAIFGAYGPAYDATVFIYQQF